MYNIYIYIYTHARASGRAADYIIGISRALPVRGPLKQTRELISTLKRKSATIFASFLVFHRLFMLTHGLLSEVHK